MSISSLPAEVSEVHTGIMRLALGVEESRAYWSHVDPAVPQAHRVQQAFEERWFGPKSQVRVQYLIRSFVRRYDAYPEALSVLTRWGAMDPETRRVVCHWHLQLTCPLYRRFSSQLLAERRAGPRNTVDYALVQRWVMTAFPGRWAVSSCGQFAGKLLSAAHEAGLVSSTRDPRTLALPRVTDLALGYLLYLLRAVAFEGHLLENPYLTSVGLTGSPLEDRLRRVPGISYRRMAHLRDLEWGAPNLLAWAEEAIR